MRKVTVELHRPYTVLIEREALAHCGAVIRKYVDEGARAVLVSTKPIRGFVGARVEESLRRAGVEYTAIEMKDGERHKTLATVEELALRLVEAGADRQTVVLALGGGVVGDVAGFLAAIYMRGVDVIQVPTTLVAMIDSAIGGKTGVNLKPGKNLLGSYYHPRVVIVDPLALNTLPDREYRSGLCEAIKYGIIRSRELFDLIEKNRQEIARRDPEKLETLIAECVRLKAEIVVADERESDLRRILNFGHTYGHALETATDYRHFLHGEAVGWGMIACCELAVRMHRLEPETARRISDAILALAGPLPPIPLTAEQVLPHLASDKKIKAGVLHFILPREVGRVEVVKNIPGQAIHDALAHTIELSKQAALAGSFPS